jgi:D-3-phosphoglycerate dehydrogenase / 2-oxoglutarate reductase
LKANVAHHNPQVLVVHSRKVDADIIDIGKSLQMIVVGGQSTDQIDTAHAAKRGIFVANCPGKSANAVSELTVGLMIAIDRRMAEANTLLH